jgi:hypothetical protein
MSAIDEYLGELARTLRLCRAPGKRLVLEVEDHLREATAEAVAVGVPPVVAEQQAVSALAMPPTSRGVSRRLRP